MGRSPNLVQSIITVLHIAVLASKITIVFSLVNKNHGILFLYILVIVCVNLTSNAVIFFSIFAMITEHTYVDKYQAFSSP